MAENKPPEALLSPEFLCSVSKEPGVYLMKANDDSVLYVGKARDLRKRLRSYTRSLGDFSCKTGLMLRSTDHIETVLTQTEKEALILEASLIKEHKPKYNIILRDDKNYPLIKITINESWPRLIVTRRRSKKDTAVFGPYSSVSAMRKTIKFLNSIYPLRRCKTKEIKARKQPCLNYQINRCLGACAGKISRKEYLENVNQLIMILSGRNNELLKKLHVEMHVFSQTLEFEKAAVLRDRIHALTKTMEIQVVSASHHKDQDAFGFSRLGNSVAVCVLRVRNGIINGHHTYFLPETFENDKMVFAEVLERFYQDVLPPKEVLLPFAPHSFQLIKEWLNEMSNSTITIKIPQRGFSKKIIQMALKNAEQVFEDKEKQQASWAFLAQKIKHDLKLKKIPERIACLDISHMSGDQTVGAVVNFKSGVKDAKYYRHFKIKNVVGPDDYASMAELVKRYINMAQKKFMPDLLLVDGGKGQVNIVLTILKEIGINKELDLAGIAKEKADEGEKIYRPARKNPIHFSRNSPVLLLLMKIRDEAHRFGITFHRKWRTRKNLGSTLDEISGVGLERKKLLLKNFGSVKRIAAAKVSELESVNGVGGELAKKIWHHFNENDAI